jgi:hypothetical protein
MRSATLVEPESTRPSCERAGAAYWATMSQANVDLVRRWFEGLERGELSPEICDEAILIRNWESPSVPRPRGTAPVLGRFR